MGEKVTVTVALAVPSLFLVMLVLSIEKLLPLFDNEMLPVRLVPVTVNVFVVVVPAVTLPKSREVGLAVIAGPLQLRIS